MKRFRIFPLLLIAICAIAIAHAKQNVLSDSDLLSLANDKYANGELPLGDQHYRLDGPRKGYIYLCHPFGDANGGGAQNEGNWIHGSTWNIRQKPSVQGSVMWPDAQFSVVINGDTRVLEGNGLPVHYPTGNFPISPGDPVSVYDRNPNRIIPQTVHEALPLNPIYSDTPFCMGMEVGIMLNGVPLFNGFDAGLRDAAAHEIQDICSGHPQRSGQYHYHSFNARCLKDDSEKTVIGYALDGFPITGSMVTDSRYLTTGDLDECHGITSEIIEDGKPKVTYHYVMTMDFPYSASCFRARPVRTGPANSENGMKDGNSGGGNLGNAPHRPPPEALAACEGKNDGDACGFTSPRGHQIVGTCRTPPQSGLACVPGERENFSP